MHELRQGELCSREGVRMDGDERAIAWAEIDRIVEEVRPLLAEDFMRTVLDGAVRVARDPANPLRGNLFAAAMREVIGTMLHSVAPDADVKASAWFKPETQDGRPSRGQRLSYWVRGGLEDRYVAKTLDLDLGQITADLRKAFDSLNRATHVREETQVHQEEEVIELVASALKALHFAFLDASNCRLSVVEAVADQLEEEATDAFIRETIGAIDELATHHSIDAVEVSDAAVIALGPKELKYEVTGRLSVTLQWGSGSDQSRDIGATSAESFPFTMWITAPVEAPHELQDAATYSIDMRGWYGEDYEVAEAVEEDFS